MKTSEIPLGSIVVGIDGSSGADAALDWAMRQATLEGRQLVLLHAVGRESGTARARSVLAATRSRVQDVVGGDDLLEVLDIVDPRVSLLAASGRASLIVVGSRGRGSVASVLLGSVSASISRDAGCPVVVVRPRVRVAGTFAVVAVDGTPESLPVTETAFRMASLRGLPLRVVHYTGTYDGGDLEGAKLELAEAVAGLSEKFPDVRVSRVTGEGFVEDAVAAVADAAELTVIGRHRRQGLGRWLRTAVATAVLESSHGTVMIVPEAG